MSTADSMAKVISTLDWDGDLGPASLAAHEAEQLRSRLGDGATRWVAGAVEQSLAALHGQIHDSLAPWPIIRTFAQHVLTATLLRLAGEDEPPADTEAIDRDLAEDIVARDIPLSEITHTLRSMQREWLSLLIEAAVRRGSRRHQRHPGIGDVGHRDDGCVGRRCNRCGRRGAPARLPGRTGSRSGRDRIAGGWRTRGCRSGHPVASNPADRLARSLRHRSTRGSCRRTASHWTASCTCSLGASAATGCCDTKPARGRFTSG